MTHNGTLSLEMPHDLTITLRTKSNIHLDRLLCQFLLRVRDRVWGMLYLGERQGKGGMDVAKVWL